jgi:hypothetical protein
MTPSRQFENLVYQQHLSSGLVELSGKLHQAVSLEEEVVHVYIQASSVIGREIFLGILQQEGGLANASAAFYSDKAVTPIYFVHQGATHGFSHVLQQILVRSE